MSEDSPSFPYQAEPHQFCWYRKTTEDPSPPQAVDMNLAYLENGLERKHRVDLDVGKINVFLGVFYSTLKAPHLPM